MFRPRLQTHKAALLSSSTDTPCSSARDPARPAWAACSSPPALLLGPPGTPVPHLRAGKTPREKRHTHPRLPRREEEREIGRRNALLPTLPPLPPPPDPGPGLPAGHLKEAEALI